MTLFCSFYCLCTGQGVYEKLNIQRIITSAPREATCYNPTPGVGHYKCLEIPVGIIHLSKDGHEWSISTSYKLDGNVVDKIKLDFGVKSAMCFTAVQKSIADITLSKEVKSKEILDRLQAFADLLKQFSKEVDIKNRPENLYAVISERALFDLTEAFIRSDAATAEKIAFLENSQNTAKTLGEITTKGLLNVGTSLVPFVSDARDFYELVSGRDLVTGEPIDMFGRFLTGVALIAGNGNIYRKAVDKVEEGLTKKILQQALPGIPGLKYTGSGGWVSEAGIIYRKGVYKKGEEVFPNSLRHILEHTTAKLGDPKHTVFSIPAKEVPKLIDEAWLLKPAKVLDPKADAYIVDMGRVIGTNGEKQIKIIMQKGTQNITTAYPVKLGEQL
jgi:hypothetical protein